MGKVIVIEFVTLDGVVEDPDGRPALPGGRLGVPRRPRGRSPATSSGSARS